MGEVYDDPKYYELAFSFRDIPAEVDVFEALITQYSRIPVSQVLELGCGPAPHLVELARRGYRYVGLDLSRPMLASAQQRAGLLQIPAKFHLASMIDFRLEEPVDFAFILLGSLYASNTTELLFHFDAISRALKPGGLYLLDWCVQFALPAERTEAWEMSRGDLTVRTTYQLKPVNPVEQTVEEIITLEAEDTGTPVVLREVLVRREIYPQEFLLLMASRSDFDFVG
jgi:SAM-dependent methyltransferase